MSVGDVNAATSARKIKGDMQAEGANDGSCTSESDDTSVVDKTTNEETSSYTVTVPRSVTLFGGVSFIVGTIIGG